MRLLLRTKKHIINTLKMILHTENKGKGYTMKESRVLEFKSDITNTFLKTVSAFANFGTGRILFGVDDDGNTVGIENSKETCLNIENKINDSISPIPDYTLQINEKTNVITLEVKEGKYKPYYYKAKAYKRNDTATIEVDRLELANLILEGENLTFDEIKSEKQNLSFEILGKQMKEKLGISSFSTDIQRTLGLMDKDKIYNNAAALLSDENNFSGIDIARMGENVNFLLDRNTVSGVSVLKQYDTAVKYYKQYYQFEQIQGVERKKHEKIPENAFREAVANAIVHREWNMNANIRILLWNDRIEIVSPGGLPNGVIKEDYLQSRLSVLRNPILADVFFRLNLIERFGTGIMRINEAYSDSKKKPIFNISESSISVTLPVVGLDNLTDDQMKVYELMSEGRTVGSSEVSEKTGFGRTKSLEILKFLVKNGYSETIGNGRGTKYKIKE